MLRRFPPSALAILPALALAIAGVLVLLDPVLRAELAVAWGLLLDGNPDPLREWLLGFGAWAPLVSTLLQIAVSVFPPLPSFLIAIANAMLYGFWLGGALTFVTSLLAAGVCFGIARGLGRPGVERIVKPENLRRMDDFMARRGLLAIFLGRIIPFINPDVVSYAAGVTGIRWIPFFVAMALGSIPATTFYSIVGASAIDATGHVLLLVGASSLLPLALLYALRKRIPGWVARWDARGGRPPSGASSPDGGREAGPGGHAEVP